MSILKRHPSFIFGLGITILFLALVFVRVDFLDTLELKFYDIMVNFKVDPDSSSDILLVDIDEDSIEKLGRWPWPRSLLATGLDKINAGNPKVIGFNLILSEPEKVAGLSEIKNLKTFFSQNLLPGSGKTGAVFLRSMEDAELRLDNDRKLAESITKSGNILLPVYFQESAVAAQTGAEKNPQLVAQAIQDVRNPEGFDCPWANRIVLPVPAFMEAAQGIGHTYLGSFNLSLRFNLTPHLL